MKSKLLISVAALGLLIGGLVGCNGKKESSEPAPSSSAPASSQPSSSSAQPSSTSQAPASSSSSNSSAAPVHEHSYAKVGDSVKNADQKDVYLMECADKDDKYIGIAFDDFSEKSADFGSTSGYNNVPEELRNSSKLLAKNSTVSWKVNVDKAISGAKLAFGVVYTGSDHGTQTGADGNTTKYSFKVNDGEFVDWALGSTTYDEAGLSQTARAYLVYGEVNLVAGENVITLKQNNAGYRLLYGGEVRIHYSSDAKPVEAPIPFEGYNVTFVPDEHVKVFVYSTKQYATETPVETNTAKAKDENGNIVAYDPEDSELQPQISFKVVCDEGYAVPLSGVVVTGGLFKNIKQGPYYDNGVLDLPDANHFRITKIQGDITITITSVNGELKLPEAKFITNHCDVVVYKGETISDENIVAEGPFYARDKKTGEPVQSGGQIYFKVVPETGYVWNHGVTESEVLVSSLPFIAQKSENSGNKFKPLENGVFNITKVNDDLSILINCVPEGGEAGLGYEITFVTEHCSVLVYQTKDYEFTPTAPVDDKALSRTEDGSAAKYVKEVKGVDANGDGDYDDEGDTKPVAEVKPQVSFLVVCDEGYEFNSGIENGAEAAAADVSFISGDFNKVKNIGDGIYRVTKIKGDLTITITATSVVA